MQKWYIVYLEGGENMITYDQALHLAKDLDPNVNVFYDYPDVYLFTNTRAKGSERLDNEIIIQKSSGDIIGHLQWITSRKYKSRIVKGNKIK